jgi:COP9 signalosome complex subunit 12
MSSVFSDFREAQSHGSGPLLAAAIIPIAPPEDPYRLHSFYYSTNGATVACDIRNSLLQNKARGVKLPKHEGNTWVDIFTAFWKTTAEIIKFEESPSQGSWVKVFEAWKEVANLLIRGYSTGILQAWTVPCLYVVGKYLRAFAIKADAELSCDSVAFNDSFQDDDFVNVEKNAKLEDTARTINRMFTLCLSDRHESLISILRLSVS